MATTRHAAAKPWLPIAAGATGLALTSGLIGFVGWEAVHRDQSNAPMIEVQAGAVHAAPQGFVLEFEARNTSGRSAAGVIVEATLAVPGERPIVSTVTLDYVPGHSKRKGGIFLPAHPGSGRLELRALGYAEP